MHNIRQKKKKIDGNTLHRGWATDVGVRIWKESIFKGI